MYKYLKRCPPISEGSCVEKLARAQSVPRIDDQQAGTKQRREWWRHYTRVTEQGTYRNSEQDAAQKKQLINHVKTEL
jgi:hypothetical protein